MMHLTIKQATNGETGYYEVEASFGGIVERGAKRHLDNLLCLLDWVFGNEFTYTVELAEIPMIHRKPCSDQNLPVAEKSVKAKALDIKKRCSR